MKIKGLLFLFVYFIFCFSLFSQSPGGVGKLDMSLWVRGDFGVSNPGTLSWSDDSGLGNNVIQPTASAQATQSSSMNFNSTFTFDGNSDRFAITNKNYVTNESISQLYTFVVYKTGFNNTTFTSNWSFLDFDRSETFNFYVHGNGRLAMSYQSGGTQDLVASTVSNDNKPHLGTFIFNNSLIDESVMRLDGGVDYEEDITSTDIVALSNRYGFIGDGSEATSENGTANDFFYDGEIAEIIFYEQSALSATDIQKIESYLAIKYGITLNQSLGSYVNSSNTVIWDNATYWNDVAGIINDSSIGSINQKIAKSSDQDELIVSTDNDFITLNNDASRTSVPLGASLLFGNDDGNIEGLELFDAINNEYILDRKWYFEEVGETGSVYIAIPKTLFSGQAVDLIVSTDDTFDNSDTRFTLSEDVTYYYTTININDGDRISFVMGDLYTPGGVSGAALWYKADRGVAINAGGVEAVSDQTGNGNNILQPNSISYPSNDALMNFNPTFTFDGANDRLPIENKNYTSSDALNQVYVWTVYATTFSSTSQVSNSFDSTNWAFLDFDRSEYFNTSVTGDGRLGFYYHPSGSSIIDNKATTITNNGVPHIGGFTFDINETNETTIRLNGDIELNEDRTSSAIGSTDTRFGYVGDGSEAATFNSAANNSYYSGDISEIIYFENEVLDASKIETIESYLAFKYGITLNQDTPTNYYASDWDGTTGTIMRNVIDNVNYNNDIAGIGLDSSSDLDQRISKSQNEDGLIVFSLDNDFTSANNAVTRTTLHTANLSFMTWGNNDESIAWDTTGATKCENQILSRVWRIDEVGAVGNVFLSVADDSSADSTKLPEVNTSLFLVTKTTDADFTTGATVTEMVLNGTNWELPSSIDLVDGTYFTFETLRAAKTATGTDWADSSNWMPAGIPIATDNVIIPNGIDMTIDSSTNALANNVSIEAGGGLIIETSGTLTATCEVSLKSTSTSYSSLILDGTITGDVAYDRHINIAAVSGASTTANDLVSAPLTGQTFGDFRAENTNILSGMISGSPAFLFGPFDSNAEVYVNYSASDDASTLDAGVGYRTGSTDNGTYAFTGTVETGTITVPLVTGVDSFWNLVGNPYPSYVNVQDFLNDVDNQLVINSGASFGIYGYDGAALDGWTIYNLANTTSTTVITPGQGFLIATEPGASGDITFTPSMRSTGNTDDFIVGRNESTSDLTFLKLKVNTADKSYKTDFYFNANASKGLDSGYDSKLWNSSMPNFALYSHLVEDNNNQPMAIQSFNDSELSDVTIPLGVHSNQGELLTFSVDESTLPSGTIVFLKDLETNTTTKLNMNDYQITPATDLNGTGRFYLNITSTALSSEEDSFNQLKLYNNPQSQVLVLEGLLLFDSSISLYDMQGRLITTMDLKSNVYSQNIEFKNLNDGIYVAEISGNNISKVQKVIFSKR